MKRNARLLLWIMLVVPLSVFVNVGLNNWRLWSLNNQFQKIPHPPNSAVIKDVKMIGNVSGTHDQCDYFIGQLRTYQGSEESLRSSYKSSFKSLKSQNKPIEIAIFKDYQFDDDGFQWINSVNNWFNPRPRTGKILYVVYYWEGGCSPWLDYRCY